MKEGTKTWIVVRLDGFKLNASVHPHEHTAESAARQEAERLAQTNTGKKFVVFEAATVSEAPAPFVETRGLVEPKWYQQAQQTPYANQCY